MVYKIYVKDSVSGLPLPGATLTIRANDGFAMATLQGGGTGTFTVDTDNPLIGVSDMYVATITASAPGYQSLAISGANLQPENDVLLLQGAKQPHWILPAVLIAGFTALHFLNRPKKSSRG